jgi:hypothetical protein
VGRHPLVEKPGEEYYETLELMKYFPRVGAQGQQYDGSERVEGSIDEGKEHEDRVRRLRDRKGPEYEEVGAARMGE